MLLILSDSRPKAELGRCFQEVLETERGYEESSVQKEAFVLERGFEKANVSERRSVRARRTVGREPEDPSLSAICSRPECPSSKHSSGA